MPKHQRQWTTLATVWLLAGAAHRWDRTSHAADAPPPPDPAGDVLSALHRTVVIAYPGAAVSADARANLEAYVRDAVLEAWRELLRDELPSVPADQLAHALGFSINVSSTDDRARIRALIRMQVRSVIPRLAFLRQFPPMSPSDRERLSVTANRFYDDAAAIVRRELAAAGVAADRVQTFNAAIRDVRAATIRGIGDNTWSTRFNRFPSQQATEAALEELATVARHRGKELGGGAATKGSGAPPPEFRIQGLAIDAQKRFSTLTLDPARRTFDAPGSDAVYRRLVEEYNAMDPSRKSGPDTGPATRSAATQPKTAG